MRKWVIKVLFAAAIAAVAYFAPLKLERRSAPAYDLQNMQRAIGLAKAFRVFALDHEGASPASLADFYADADWFGDFGHGRQDYFDPKSKKEMAWLYFPVKDMEKGDDETPFFVSPLAYKGERVVVFTDTSGTVVKEEECEEMLRAMGER